MIMITIMIMITPITIMLEVLQLPPPLEQLPLMEEILKQIPKLQDQLKEELMPLPILVLMQVLVLMLMLLVLMPPMLLKEPKQEVTLDTTLDITIDTTLDTTLKPQYQNGCEMIS
jgi:hypothetical protein